MNKSCKEQVDIEKRDKEICEKLKYGIRALSTELDMDLNLVESCINNLSKEELIDKFIELKELRIKVENARIIELLE